jgi:hypothetical protein
MGINRRDRRLSVIQEHQNIKLKFLLGLALGLGACGEESLEGAEGEYSYLYHPPVEEAKENPFLLDSQGRQEIFYSFGTLVELSINDCEPRTHVYVSLVHESEPWMVRLGLPFLRDSYDTKIHEQDSFPCSSSLEDEQATIQHLSLRERDTVVAPINAKDQPATLESWFMIENINESEKILEGNLDATFVLEDESVHLQGDFTSFLQITR